MSNPQRRTAESGTGIGAAGIFALVIIVCMAVLAVLTVATAHSSLVLAQRQAAAVEELYHTETAGQTFLAQMDAAISGAADPFAAANAALAQACRAAQDSAPGITATAALDGSRITAEFTGSDGRVLKVALTIHADGTYSLDMWRMTAVVNQDEPIGPLYIED